jgi:hybrid polyketide synthase / nonribosomal peptide synthetase ACE1
MDELWNCYNSNNLMREPPRFSEYSEKQHADAATGKYETEIGFWKTELSSIPPPLGPLPMLSLSKVASRPTKKVCGNERAILVLSKERKARVQQVCRRCRATPFHFYLTILRVLILRYTPSALDIAVTVGNANRTDDRSMRIMGPLSSAFYVRLPTYILNYLSHLRVCWKVFAPSRMYRWPTPRYHSVWS